jgi:four helix bundle protein
VRFLYIAYGSVCELETQTKLSGDLGYVGKERLEKLRAEIGDVERMLKALIKSLENKHLDPGTLGPFLPTNWEKNHIY